MAKVLLFYLLLFPSVGSATELKAIISFLERPAAPVLNVCQETPIAWNRDAESVGTIKLQCPEDWYAKDFHFDLAYYHCQTRYGKSAQSCSDHDLNKVRLRAQDADLMARMNDFAVKRFQEYKTRLSSQCCGDRQKCLKRFGDTKLVISDADTSSATYNSDGSPDGRNYIEITKLKMASTMNQESLERVLLVELAHSCQFALAAETPESYRRLTSNPCDINAGREMFAEGLGAEMSACLEEELQAQINAIPEKERGNYCFGKWYREAFSDMRFRSEFTSIYHWTYDFLRRSQHKNYASVIKYIKCGLKPEIKAQVCK